MDMVGAGGREQLVPVCSANVMVMHSGQVAGSIFCIIGLTVSWGVTRACRALLC